MEKTNFYFSLDVDQFNATLLPAPPSAIETFAPHPWGRKRSLGMLRRLSFAILMSGISFLAASSQQQTVFQKHPVYPQSVVPPHTAQEVLLLFSGNTADERILLTLNNNRPDTLTTEISVYTASGEQRSLADIVLVSQESKIIELSPLLKAAGIAHQELGWLKLDYSGVRLEMGAQLTLYPEKEGPGVDSPRSLSGDFKSGERDTVFWLPDGGKAHLSLTNASVGSIFVKMNCSGISEEFVIPAKTSKLRQLEQPGSAAGFPSRNTPYSCELTSDGPVDALRPVGTVTASHYSAPIRFYDPRTATFPSLTAVGIDTSAESHIMLHNTTDGPVVFTPIVREAILEQPDTQTGTAQTLAPHASVEVKVAAMLGILRSKAISRATLTLTTSAPKGALVGSLTQISEPDRLVEDIPLRTSNPPAFARGSYPLRWDQDYTNLVTVTNTADETLRIGGEITAGDVVYVLTRSDVPPGGTMVFDVDRWKNESVADINGKTIPRDALYGKLHWIEMSNGSKAGLLGRTSLTSLSNKRKSSFSCGSTCEYNYTKFPYYDGILGFSITNGGATSSQLTEYDSMVNGAYYTYPFPYRANSVWTSSTGILTASANPTNANALRMTAIGRGLTTVYDNFTENDWTYDPDFEECDQTQTVTEESNSSSVLDNTPLLTGIYPSDWKTGTSQSVTFTGEYFGTNPPTLSFTPNVGIGYTLTSHSDTQIVANVTVVPGVPNESVAVSVTNNGYGTAFMSGGGLISPTSAPVFASVHTPVSSPEITVIAWVNPAAPDLVTLPGGENSLLYSYLQNATTAQAVVCAATLFNISRGDLVDAAIISSSDRLYANTWLVKNSTNATPPPTIVPTTQYMAGQYRLFNDFGNSVGGVNVGITPDPCKTGVIPDFVAAGESYPNNGKTGTSATGKTYQLAEGRIGYEGQLINLFLNGGRSTPWIWSVIEFDSTGAPIFASHSIFPTFYYYKSGVLQPTMTVPQSAVSSFIGLDQNSSQLTVTQIP